MCASLYYSFNVLQYIHYALISYTAHIRIWTQDRSAITVCSYLCAKCGSQVVSGKNYS